MKVEFLKTFSIPRLV